MGAARRAWNAADHPRGPTGRFIKGGGGSSASTSRPSLAEAVRGTAAGGPKRQRADRLASPANSSAPAPRSGPRPGSAAAMFAAGAGKGRIHAATSRPKATPLSIEPVKIEPGGGTRGRLDRMSNEQLERGLLMHGNQSAKGKAIQAEASRRSGPTPAAKAGPAVTAAPRRPAQRAGGLSPERATEIGDRLKNATSREQARRELAGLTAPQLRALAAGLNASVGAKYTKAQLIERLVEVAGRRLDSTAIDQMASSKKSARQMMSG